MALMDPMDQMVKKVQPVILDLLVMQDKDELGHQDLMDSQVF
jgi:hypothetical protein